MDRVDEVQNEEEQENELLEEMLQLVEDGFVFRKSPVFVQKNNTAYFYFVNIYTEETINKIVNVTEEEFKRIKETLEGRMKELYGFTRHDVPQNPQKQQKTKVPAKTKAAVESELGRSYALFLRNLADQVDWWTQAMNDIGFFATLTALQLAKVDPGDLYGKINVFRNNPKAFVDFVKENFVALLEAKNDAEAIIKYRREVGKLALKLETMYEIAKRYKVQRDKLLLLYNTAVSVMCNNCKNRFLVSQAVLTVGGGEVGELAD